MNNPVCPKTGAPMYRDTRPMTLTYKGEGITFDMPGWYCDSSDESIHRQGRNDFRPCVEPP